MVGKNFFCTKNYSLPFGLPGDHGVISRSWAAQLPCACLWREWSSSAGVPDTREIMTNSIIPHWVFRLLESTQPYREPPTRSVLNWGTQLFCACLWRKWSSEYRTPNQLWAIQLFRTEFSLARVDTTVLGASSSLQALSTAASALPNCKDTLWETSNGTASVTHVFLTTWLSSRFISRLHAPARSPYASERSFRFEA